LPAPSRPLTLSLYDCRVGESYAWVDSQQLELVQRETYVEDPISIAGLSQEEFECADHMIKMCKQYLGLVAKKLRHELPKMIFSDLLCTSSELETRLRNVIRTQSAGILEAMIAEPPEVKEERRQVESKLRCLDRMSNLLKCPEFSLLIPEPDAGPSSLLDTSVATSSQALN
jgi:hypothetical protein